MTDDETVRLFGALILFVIAGMIIDVLWRHWRKK